MEYTIIHGWRVEGIAETAAASGNPHRITFGVIPGPHDSDMNMPRLKKLAAAQIGSGHDTALKGITVWIDMYTTQNIHRQLLRYQNMKVVSSMSMEHSIREIVADDFLTQLWDKQIRELIRSNAEHKDDQWLKDNSPMATLLGVSFVTNYLQLKTVYAQRQHHKNPGWKPIVKWITGLPYAQELIIGANHANT